MPDGRESAENMVTSKKDKNSAFDLKGSAFTILVLSLRTADIDAVAAQLVEKTGQAPDFFQNAPVVIDLQYLKEDDQIDLAMLVSLIRAQGLVPAGVTGCTEQQKVRAEIMELAVLAARTGKKQPPAEQDTEPTEKNEKKETGKKRLPTQAPALLISDPVRSGQRITVEQRDLIVMAAVGSGAEITASGNIHVYGALRGRAFAGSDSNKNARIFCQRLEAELVSIAGVHLVNEDFPTGLRSGPVQIQLHGTRLHIKAL